MTDSNAQKASSTLVTLFGLIQANDWDKLYDMFLDKPEGCNTFRCLAALVAKSSSFNGMTVLHAVVRFDPPSIIIKRIIELCPEAPRSQDCLQRTPLHVAAGSGAGSIVIKVLVDAYPDACMIQDFDKRTPLHMACDTSTELFENSSGVPREPPCYRTVGALLKASPGSAILEDTDGMNAIEYALCSNADLQTVRLIQKAAQKKMIQEHKKERTNRVATRKVSVEEKDLTSSMKNGISQAAKRFTPRRVITYAPSA
ncbi:hypothetical protein ACHAXR_008056 [Thalassiosira sp. AJA248-18]